MKYEIRKGIIYIDGEDTGIKAPRTKADIEKFYNWSSTTRRNRLKEIEYKLYSKNRHGEFKNRIQSFDPIQIIFILNEFGIP